MKIKNVVTLILLTAPLLLISQDENDENNYGWNKRFSFIVGGGVSFVTNDLYLDPVINKTDSSVIIEKAGIVKPNLTLGIVFTPKVYNVERIIKVVNAGGDAEEKILIEHYPRKLSFALYLNPVSISNISSSSILNTVDLGLGIGWREGNFSFFITNEYFAIRQPRGYFVKQFEANNTPYIVNGEVQYSIDPNDNAVFTSKIGVSFGVKMAYTFDLVKSFYSKSQELAKKK